jgi:hypothetical protein
MESQESVHATVCLIVSKKKWKLKVEVYYYTFGHVWRSITESRERGMGQLTARSLKETTQTRPRLSPRLPGPARSAFFLLSPEPSLPAKL